MIGKSPLPYRDTKPQGAAGFYLAINSTFRFIREQFGFEGLIRYWTDLGREYFRPVGQLWKREGLPGVASYWRAFFDAEPGSEVEVEQNEEKVTLHVHTCPLIAHLRSNQREIESVLCQHCYYISQAIGEMAGIETRVEGGNGSCVQHFYPAVNNPPLQSMEAIRKC